MRIKSNFQDYYDNFFSIYTTGQSSLIYNRYEKKILNDELDSHIKKSFKHIQTFYNNFNYISLFSLGFAGQIYPGCEIYANNEKYFSYTKTGSIFISEKSGLVLNDTIRAEIKAHFEKFGLKQSQLFYKLNCPIFIAKNKNDTLNLIANCKLARYDFEKVVPGVDVFPRLQAMVAQLDYHNAINQLEMMPVLS